LSDDSNVTHYFNNTTSKAMPLLPSPPQGAQTLPFDELLMQGMAIRGQHGQYVNCSQCGRMLVPGEGCAKCMTAPTNEAIYCLDDNFTLHLIFTALFYRPRKRWRTEPMSRPFIMAISQDLMTSNVYIENAYSTSIRLERITTGQLAMESSALRYQDQDDPRGWPRHILNKIQTGNFQGLYEQGYGPEEHRELHWAQMVTVFHASLIMMGWSFGNWGMINMTSIYACRGDETDEQEDALVNMALRAGRRG
jgi:hypothetical protein